MGSAKETERKPDPDTDTEVDKTIDKGVEVSDANEESGSDDEESGYVVVRARPSSPTSSLVSFQDWRDGVDTWMAKSDAWRDQTDDKLKALTDVLLETRELVRSLSRGELDGGDQARAAREVGRASESLDTGNPEEREDLLAPEVPALPQIKEDVNPNIKEESSKTGICSDITPPTAQVMAGASSAQGPVKEEEIRAVLLQRSLTTSELVDTFKARLQSLENKKAFAEILKRISKIQKIDNQNYVVLRK